MQKCCGKPVSTGNFKLLHVSADTSVWFDVPNSFKADETDF